MSTTTEAYVARPPAPPTLETITYPPLTAHEVLVDIAAASICHTDVRAARGDFFLVPPLIIGHEGAGHVRAVGPGVTYVQPGDAVVLAFASCLQCRRCQRGQNPYCEKLLPLNFSGTREDGEVAAKGDTGDAVKGFFFGQSSMARVAMVREESCVKVGNGISPEVLRKAASLGCGLQTGAGAIMNVVKPPPGSNIAIFGGGGVGLSAVLAAQLTDPGCIILVDNSQTKLDMIPKSILGPETKLINSAGKTNDETAAELRALTPNSQGVDYALDCVGNTEIIKTAHAALDKLGMLVTIGSGSPQMVAGFTLGQHVVKGITHRGTHQGDSVARKMVPKLLRMYAEGNFPFDQLLTEFRFEDMETALAEMKKGTVIKPLLVL